MSEKTVLLRCDVCGITRVGTKQVDDETGDESLPPCEKCNTTMYEQEPGKSPRPTVAEQARQLKIDEAEARHRNGEIGRLEKRIVADRARLKELNNDRRSVDQVKASEDAFVRGTLPEDDRRQHDDSTGTA